jgi:uncharacterized protein YukE
MPAGFLGLDPEEMERIASRMDAEAQKMDEALRQVTTQLKSVQWVGPDRDRFEREWTSDHQVSIRRTVELLRTNARDLKRHAKEQRATSGR